MVPLTRRRLLHGASALAIGLAGCSGTSSSGRSSSNLPTDAENVELDPDVVALRNTEDEPTVWIGQRPTETRTPTEREPRITDREAGLIASADRAAQLSFGDVNGRTGARSFVEATDFETETLLLETRRIAECYTLECCAVTWSTDDYHTYFGRTLRPAEVACETDARDRVSHLVRIPDTLNPDQITSWGSGSSAGSCAKFRARFERAREQQQESEQ